ncbi:sensor histidine kinase [Cohnella rhizosphaerae]|uniref:Histidine kinase n=1 Tax=Cohnella rhizosphaerae TaxID=1457232 RepID=A0A9X4KRE3_9BACL|nr:histidine kinase [Cohnella rhizosphaerae]MDG0808831.1 histidine kinase [Cohnella rhizosphaerae]
MSAKARISYKKQMIVILLLFIVPFLACLLSYNLYTANTVVNANIIQENKSKIGVFSNSFERSIANITTFMTTTVANDTNFRVLGYQSGKLNAYLSAYEILNKCKDILSMDESITGLFLFSTANELYWNAFQNRSGTENRSGLSEQLRTIVSRQDYTSAEWFVRELNGQPYLIRVLSYNRAYFIGIIDLNKAVRSLNADSSANANPLLFATDRMELLTMNRELDQAHYTFQHNQNGEPVYLKSGKTRYRIIESDFGVKGIKMIYLVAHRRIWHDMNGQQFSLFFASIVCLLLVPLCYFLLKRSFFTPLNSFVGTMNSIKEGHLDVRMSNRSPILEFEQMSSTFNEMLHEIKSLKIVAYEHQLDAQRATMQFLRIQIRPHFYLNCLNNLYALAQNGEYKKIQEMILVLSKYLRDMFRQSPYLVPLSAEVHNIETYVKLQTMTQSTPIYFSVDMDEGLRSFPIPPITILTFVENAIKFGIYRDKPLIVNVKARYLQDGDSDCVNITIVDNGKGFSEDELKALNAPHTEENTTHVGIGNVKRRFFFQYQGEAVLFFSNSNGACIEIFIPLSTAGAEPHPESNEELV